MLEHVDGMMALGSAAALGLGAFFVWHLVQNPTDKVEARPAAPRGSALGCFAALRRRARGWRELRASQRRAKVLARIELRRGDRATVRDAYTLTERPPDPPPMRRRPE